MNRYGRLGCYLFLLPTNIIMMKRFLAGWYLIYTKPRHEKKLHIRLNERNIHSFLPTKKMLRTWHDRKKCIEEPLFPSYVFIYLNDMQNYYDAIDTEGALYYVRTGNEVARVGESIISNIKLLTTGENDVEVSYSRFLPGHRLVITEGALAGLSGEVVRCDSKHKLLIRVDLLGRNLLLTLSEEYLMAI